jgi:tripartite-type tricarboxylate transporter receptor subunit TctC
MKKIFKSLLLACAVAAGMANAAFPERTITMVVPYAPGGAGDIVARQLAVQMGKRLGTSVIVDNRPGASATIGAAYVARAAKDGYTLLYDATPFSINPALYPNLPYDDKSFQPLSLVTLMPNILIVRSDSPVKDQAALLSRAKAEPGKINFASGGSGTVQRMAAELYRQGLGLDMVHVPYKSGGPAISDVMSGQVDFMFSNMAASYPLVSAGKLRALAISSPKRSPLLPETPSVAESVLPGYEVYEWAGVLVPTGTPAAIVQQLNKAVVESLQDEALKKRLAEMGAEPVGSTPAEFATFLEKERVKWADTVRRGNIKVD